MEKLRAQREADRLAQERAEEEKRQRSSNVRWLALPKLPRRPSVRRPAAAAALRKPARVVAHSGGEQATRVPKNITALRLGRGQRFVWRGYAGRSPGRRRRPCRCSPGGW